MPDGLEAASPASAARPAHESAVLNLNERRTALDGEAYTFEEFPTYYGFDSWFAIWHKSECLDSAEQPVGITASLPEDSAEQPVGTIASRPEGYHIRLSWHELVAMTGSQGCGGKAANVEQKRLRAYSFI